MQHRLIHLGKDSLVKERVAELASRVPLFNQRVELSQLYSVKLTQIQLLRRKNLPQ